YTYSWTGPNGFTSGVQDPGSLIAGVYNVTITDANGCQVTTTITLTEPTDLTLTAATTSNYTGFGVSCFGSTDGTTSSTPGGGAGGYTYSWSSVPAQ
ncbi:MAG: hypothetical protein ACK45H_13845, partial [Bacteroidota bacterium]